jgi:hypothetical protein
VIEKLNREINAGLIDPKMRSRLADLRRAAEITESCFV